MEPQAPPKDKFPLIDEKLLRNFLDPENVVDLADLRVALRNAAVAGFDRRILRVPFWHIVDHVCKAEKHLAYFEMQSTMLRAYIKDEQDTTVLKEQMKQSWKSLSAERLELVKAINLLMECRTSEQSVN